MAIEIIDIFGVKFIGPEMPVMTSENGEVTAMKNDAGKFVSFSFTNASIDDYLEFLSNFSIEILGLTNYFPISLQYDLSKILTVSLKRLHFQLENSDAVIFSKDGNNLKGINELSIRNSFPKNIPSARNFQNLIKLTIEPTSDIALQWLNGFNEVIDVVIYNFQGKNLLSLAGLKNIRRLCLIQCGIASLDGLELFPHLSTLHVVACRRLTEIQAILRSNSIRNIMFENYTKIRNWDILGQKKDLQTIWLQTADNIDFIKNLPGLTYFRCNKIINQNKSLLKERNFLNLPYSAVPFYEPFTRT